MRNIQYVSFACIEVCTAYDIDNNIQNNICFVSLIVCKAQHNFNKYMR